MGERAKENIYAIGHEFYDHPEVFGGGATGKIPFFGSVAEEIHHYLCRN